MPQIKSIDSGKILCLENHGSLLQIGVLFDQLMEYVQSRRIPLKGNRFAILYDPVDKLDRQSAHFAAAVELAGEATGDGEITVVIQPIMQVAWETHLGDYSNIQATYQVLHQWIKEQGYDIIGPIREYYLVGPGAEGPGDPETYLTEIHIPVEPVVKVND